MLENFVSQSKIKNQKSKIALAWLAHSFTALGLVLAAGMAVLIVRGDAASFRWAFLLMLVATIVDAIDGTLARWARVKEVLPLFDGRRLDDIIDFQTYTSLPLLLIWRAEILAPGFAWLLIVPLLASAYGFCQDQAKTSDGYFLGFPSYWNLVAFYLYVLWPPAWASLGLVLALSALTFLPTRYLYPTQAGLLNRVTNWLAVAWLPLPIWILSRLEPNSLAAAATEAATNQIRWIALVSLFFPLYYLVASWLVTFRLSRHESSQTRNTG
jgi:phosphatidylcholine synthase